jgi:tRNA/tmRNA/rRNA uracil-C5-methylase (TrmA/RlmC/RlmD family)
MWRRGKEEAVAPPPTRGVFCPNVIPGELVRVRVYRNFLSYSDADLLQVIKPSANRIKLACPPATVCGVGMPVPAHHV